MLRQVASRAAVSLGGAGKSSRSFAPALSTVSTSSPRVQICESDNDVDKALKAAQGNVLAHLTAVSALFGA